MNKKLILTLLALSFGAVAWAQLRITSLNSQGDLTWMHPIYRGAYSIEAASSPTGSWSTISSVFDTNWSKTNPITLRLPITNTQRFYRVGWIKPDATGVWDYQGYDTQGALILTGELSLTATNLLSTNPPVVYAVAGYRNLQYVGPLSNAPGWHMSGYLAGPLRGTVEEQNAFLRLGWPDECSDCGLSLSGAIMQNSYTGACYLNGYITTLLGPFHANRR